MLFEWDENKNYSNSVKHGVSFEEAKRVFDLAGVSWFDVDNSIAEDRYVEIGFSGGRLLAAVYVQLDNDTIRIISARRASSYEEKRYERGY